MMKIICDNCKHENLEVKTVLDFKYHQCKKCGHQQKYFDIDALIEVGTNEKKAVSYTNNQIYLKASEIVLDHKNQGANHIGLQGISAFVDWLEENYELEEK